MAMSTGDAKRTIPWLIRLQLAVDAGGRCERAGCNRFLFEHHLTLKRGFFGQNAHIFAFSPGGPRADGEIRTPIHDLSNLILLCHSCHKEVDDHPDQFNAETLRSYKAEHEARIRHVTRLGPDLRTEIIQLKAIVGGQPTGIPAGQVYEAVAPRYPSDLVGTVIDLTPLNSEDATFYAAAERIVRERVASLFVPGMEPRGPRHFSVFALAPIPLLMLLGSVLGNKVEATLHQRHRDDGTWKWKPDGQGANYKVECVRRGIPEAPVGLVISLSGCVDQRAVDQVLGTEATLYELTLDGQEPSVTYLRTAADLVAFEKAYRQLLALIRREHPGLSSVAVFPAVPAPVAVAIGRELLPKVDPTLRLYDYDKMNGFQFRLAINSYDPK